MDSGLASDDAPRNDGVDGAGSASIVIASVSEAIQPKTIWIASSLSLLAMTGTLALCYSGSPIETFSVPTPSTPHSILSPG
jgi:hypothetical protein